MAELIFRGEVVVVNRRVHPATLTPREYRVHPIEIFISPLPFTCPISRSKCQPGSHPISPSIDFWHGPSWSDFVFPKHLYACFSCTNYPPTPRERSSWTTYSISCKNEVRVSIFWSRKATRTNGTLISHQNCLQSSASVVNEKTRRNVFSSQISFPLPIRNSLYVCARPK